MALYRVQGFVQSVIPRFCFMVTLVCGCHAEDPWPKLGIGILQDFQTERSMELRLLGHKVGYAQSATSRTGDGIWIAQRRRYRLALQGKEVSFRRVVAARLDGSGALQELHRSDERGVTRLTMASDRLIIASPENGVQHIDLDGPLYAPELSASLRAQALGDAQRFTGVDPGTLRPVPMKLQATQPGELPLGGTGTWLRWDQGADLLVDTRGTLWEARTGPLHQVYVASDQATVFPELADLSALLRKPITRLPQAHRSHTGHFALSDSAGLFVHDPPRQVATASELSTTMPLMLEVAQHTSPTSLAQQARWLKPSWGVDAHHESIAHASAEIFADKPGPRDALQRLVRHVSTRIDHRPTPGWSSATSALEQGAGDCTEQAAALVSLARAGGLPARVVTGVAYFDGEQPGFLPHAWAEVYTGPPAGWVPVDPALEQAPADATHLKWSNGAEPDWERLAEWVGASLQVQTLR